MTNKAEDDHLWEAARGIDVPGVELLKLAEEITGYRADRRGVSGSGAEWNRAEGFMVCWWEGGYQLTPWTRTTNFSQIVKSEFEASYGEGWETELYDRKGRRRKLRIEASVI